MRTLGYGVIGLGFFGEKHARVAASLPQVELRALCTRRADRRRQLAQQLRVPADYADYRDLLADPRIEAVSIVTHVDEHLAPTLAALAAGKHVLLEKPMARTVAECDQMLQAAARADRMLMVGHICRFNPRYAVLKDRVQQGQLGTLLSLAARRNIPAERSRTVLEKIGPILGDGIHDTDLMLWISGQRIETAYALSHSFRGLQHDDLGWTLYRFSSGAIGVLENVWCLPPGTPLRIHEQLEIIGTAGAAYLHGGDLNVVVQSGQTIDCPDTSYWPELHGEITGALRHEIEYFVNCVARGQTPQIVTPQEARDAVAAASAAERSAATGQVVQVER